MQSDIFSFIGLVFAGCGLFANALQTQRSRKIARAQFMLNLDQLFRQHDEVHNRLKGVGWPDGRNAPGTVEEWTAVVSYMGLFERIQVLIEDGILDVSTFNDLYGYRVSYIIRNDAIREQRLVDRADNWVRFNRLWKSIEKLPSDRTFPVEAHVVGRLPEDGEDSTVVAQRARLG